MTKEEAIEIIIEEAKRGNRNAYADFCEKYEVCKDCPLHGCDGCRNSLFNRLIELLTKVEEKKETNLEHFRGNVIFNMAGGEVDINLKNGWKKSYDDHKDIIDWLLSPYEEPKPKYKLSKFENDLFDSCFNKACGIKDSWALDQMREKGYFKGIPTDVPIGYILDNCEVVYE